MRKISILAVIVLVIQCFGVMPLATAANCNWPCFLGDNVHVKSECGLKKAAQTASVSCDDILSFDMSSTSVEINAGQQAVITATITLTDGSTINDFNLIVESNCNNVSITTSKSVIYIRGSSYSKCWFLVWPEGCKTQSRVIDVYIKGALCISIPEKKVSGMVNVAQASTTIGNFSVQNCSGGDINLEVSSDNVSNIEAQSSGSAGTSYKYAAVVNNQLLTPDKLYSGKFTAKSESITKQLPYYYYTFNSNLQQTRPAGCTGWTGMGGNASRANSVPQNDAPGSFNPSLVWSGLNYELDPTKYLPAIWNNKLIKMFNDGTGKGVECYDLSNKQLLWKTNDLAYGSESFRGPSIYKNYVFVTINSRIMALDANTGSTLWSWSESGEIVSANPVIANDKVFSGGNTLRCHDIKTGVVIWRKSEAGNVYVDLTIQSGVLAVLALNIYLDDYATLNTFDCNTGKNLWHKFIDAPNLVSVFGTNSILLRYYKKDENKLTCYDSRTGDLKWEYSISGDTQWYAIPAVYDIYIILLNGKTISCIDSRKGTLIWEQATSSQITNVPVIAGNRVYVCVEYEGVYTYELKTGKLLAKPFSQTPTSLLSWVGVIPAEGTLIAIYTRGYNSNTLCCYANNDRFKKMKVTALEMSVNSKIITHNNYNTKKDYTILVAPQIINGVVCIPVKSVIDLFGGKYEITKDKSHKITFGSKTLGLKPDSPTVTINGKKTQINPKNLKITPKLVSNVLLVPSSFIGQTFGFTTHWDNQTKTVIYVYKIIY